MPNFLDFSVKTREQLKEYILTRLGHPLVTVELSDEQLEVAINSAVEEYTKYVNYEKDFLALDTSGYVEGIGFTLPMDVAGVMRVEDSGFTTNGMGIDHLFSIPNQMYNAGDMSFGAGGVMGFVNYDLFKRRMKLMGKLFATGYDYDYNERTKILKLTPDPVKIKYEGMVVAVVRLIREDDLVYGESWIKRFALEVSKEMLAFVRGKFEGTQLLGGAKLDSGFRDQAISAQKDLLEELIDLQGPMDFAVG